MVASNQNFALILLGYFTSLTISNFFLLSISKTSPKAPMIKLILMTAVGLCLKFVSLPFTNVYFIIFFNCLTVCCNIHWILNIPWKKSILIVLFSFIIGILAEGTTFLSFYYFYDFRPTEHRYQNDLFTLLGITYTNMTLLIFCTVAAFFYRLVCNQKEGYRFYSLILLPLYQFYQFFLCINLLQSFSYQMVVIGNIFFIMELVIFALFYFSSNNLVEKRKLQTQLQHLQLQREREYRYHLSNLNHLNEQHFLRHEIVNQLQTISAFAQSAQKKQTLIKFVEDLIRTVETDVQREDTDYE